MISGSDVGSPVCDHPSSLPACLRCRAELVQCRWLLAFYTRATARVMLRALYETFLWPHLLVILPPSCLCRAGDFLLSPTLYAARRELV